MVLVDNQAKVKADVRVGGSSANAAGVDCGMMRTAKRAGAVFVALHKEDVLDPPRLSEKFGQDRAIERLEVTGDLDKAVQLFTRLQAADE